MRRLAFQRGNASSCTYIDIAYQRCRTQRSSWGIRRVFSGRANRPVFRPAVGRFQLGVAGNRPRVGRRLAAGQALRGDGGVGLAAATAHVVLEHAVSVAVAVALGVGVAAALGAWLLRRGRFQPRFEQVGDVLRFVFFGALASIAVSPLIGSAVMYSAGIAPWQGFTALWWMCWISRHDGNPPGRTRSDGLGGESRHRG